ncbi:IstB domain protein ATP-binding protein [Flexistipes sinusarabici DSM 4947]|uniref:IstB domain protein ATP-binding protein n=1 Tax=Flexistipes sinusarabici (strain ATCC 49648 / DSM 4947 / MAS 10) TaxID=717231 RepID=F8E6B6_FLESM|nr:ATP-binding protein [Flexistipes sinusarabici]AEI15883.1 IstB domain protein ATP-binding protein [Flexistipes sinusarabici DSM 4947]
MSVIESVAEACKELKLSRNIVDNMQKIQEEDRYKFLLQLFQLEIQHRADNRRQRNIKSAGFYNMKSFSDYVYNDLELPSGLSISDIESAEFVRRKENLILYGNSGTGKSHLAFKIALGVASHL